MKKVSKFKLKPEQLRKLINYVRSGSYQQDIKEGMHNTRSAEALYVACTAQNVLHSVRVFIKNTLLNVLESFLAPQYTK